MAENNGRPSRAGPPRPKYTQPKVPTPTSTDRRFQWGARSRSDSNGSTRNAFGAPPEETNTPTQGQVQERKVEQEPKVETAVDVEAGAGAVEAVMTTGGPSKRSKKKRQGKTSQGPNQSERMSSLVYSDDDVRAGDASGGSYYQQQQQQQHRRPPSGQQPPHQERQNEIANFSNMAMGGADYGSGGGMAKPEPKYPSPTNADHMQQGTPTTIATNYGSSGTPVNGNVPQGIDDKLFQSARSKTTSTGPSQNGLMSSMSALYDSFQTFLFGTKADNQRGQKNDDDDDDDDDDEEEEEELFLMKTYHNLLFDPENPEFTSTQQFSWACILGVAMGVLTAKWGEFIEFCIEIVWVAVPEKLLAWGVFTELDGWFPLPYYMVIVPSVFGGLLAYITVILPTPIPGQNEWIESLHRVGVMDYTTFWMLIAISTAGMASGLSLGPELPLVLSAGMVGSYLGLKTHQSILSARVMNLTCAAAAIGGFFGFPMAGALFVLEIPHQMGLQYFEALSPATISSIVAVLVNRMVTGNDVKGYFNYPFLTETLPSHIFYVAILYGLVGSVVGIIYADGCKWLKMKVHDLFHVHDHHEEKHNDPTPDGSPSERVPLVGTGGLVLETNKANESLIAKIGACTKKVTSFGIKHEPTRAAVVGTLAGAATGLICMLVPHTLFWGEAQLQTLIDKGKTPLPVFGEEGEPTADLVAFGYCMVDPEDPDFEGITTGCSALIAVTKILTIGISLGTGVVGGHFWGPLFVGAAASNVFTDLMVLMHEQWGFGLSLSTYPCVAILCIMGSAHVVAFRAHMAIMLILTLTISAFTPEEAKTEILVGGDYSAVFPLLVVSCFISLMITRSHVFYKQQRSRGDIIASPQVLCEPLKEGMPEYPVHDGPYDEDEFGEDDDDDESWSGDSGSFDEGSGNGLQTQTPAPQASPAPIPSNVNVSQADIERDFLAMQDSAPVDKRNQFEEKPQLPSQRLDELLAVPLGNPARVRRHHRRIKSGSDVGSPSQSTYVSSIPKNRVRSNSADRRLSQSGSYTSIEKNQNGEDRSRERADSTGRPGTPTQPMLQRVNSYGEIIEFQPSLIDQARKRASSVTRQASPALPKPSSGRHSRKNSDASGVARFMGESAGALSQEDLERSFSNSFSNTPTSRGR